MAGQNYTWQLSSPNIGTGIGVISSAYSTDGKTPLTTITSTNPTGYVPLTSNDPIAKNLSYAIQTDGKITYQYTDPAGGSRQFNSLQELANAQIPGYSAATTQQIQNSLQTSLSSSAASKGITPSTPTGTGTAGSTGGFDASSIQQQIGSSVSGTSGPGSFGSYQYPKDAKFNDQDCILFTMYEYKPKSFGGSANKAGTFTGTGKGASLGTVKLSVQPQISDTNVVNWGEDSINAIQAAAAQLAYAAIGGGGDAAAKSAEEIIKTMTANKGDAQSAIAAKFAGMAAGTNSNFLSRTTGAILNNNLELLFQGPALRTFTFNFSMSARYQGEAEEIRKIIRFFKQGMSVKRSNGFLFLKAPHIFDIQYLYKGSDHTYLNKIKTCALQNFSVNYTPAGNYATFDNGAMTQYNLTMSFGEIEPIFDDDYAKLGPNHIGY